MSGPIDDYVGALRREVIGVPGFDDILSEMEDHLRESSESMARTGLPIEASERRAVERFGPAAVVGRRVRATHGRSRPVDPAPAPRWPFTIVEVSFLLAALAAAAATYIHWLPCDPGGMELTPENFPECWTRMDASTAFPFPPGPTDRTPAADALRLIALVLISGAWAFFALIQPWAQRTRLIAALPALAPLALGVETTLLMANPASDRHWWSYLSLHTANLLLIPAFVCILRASFPHRHGTERHRPPTPPMTVLLYRWRIGLLLLTMAPMGFVPLMVEYVVMSSISTFDWDTPPGSGYLTAAFIAGTALASMLVGLLARYHAVAGRAPQRSNPSATAPAGGAR